MIKQLLQLVMPQSLGFIGTTLAIGSAAIGFSENKKKRGREQDAIDNRKRVDNALRKEQNTRDRKNLMRNARVQQSQIQAGSAATGNPSSGANIASAEVSNRTATSIGNLNTANATAEAISSAEQKSLEASQPSSLQQVNNALSPILTGNIGAINDAGSAFFKSAKETGGAGADIFTDVLQPVADSGQLGLNNLFENFKLGN